MLFLMIKSGLEASSDGQRFAGGSHGFLSMARTLAAGHDVHVFTTAAKVQLMHQAVVGGYFSSLRSAAGGSVVCWTHEGLHWHVSLIGEQHQRTANAAADSASSASESTPAAAAGQAFANMAPHEASLVAEANSVATAASDSGTSNSPASSTTTWVVLDADGSQQAGAPPAAAMPSQIVGVTDSASQTAHPTTVVAEPRTASSQPSCSTTLMEGVANAFGRRVLVLVQNVHFLPFGPHGTAARTPGLLAAWAAIGGALAESCFVAEYLQQHGRLEAARVRHVGYNAVGAFGQPPFADLGEVIAADMQVGCGHVQHQQQQQQQQQLQLAPPPLSSAGPPHRLRPVVGMLKCTLEKGAAVFCQLARLLPQYDFVAVAGSPKQLETQLQRHSQQRPPPNVRFMPPHADIEKALAGMWVVLAPSVWQEAFGMVVIDAMLRGIPVITSSSGGLPEAGLGVAQVLPLQPMQLPVDAATGAPCWQQRQYPAEQELGQWVDAIRAIVGSGQEVYMLHSRAARAAALEYVGSRGRAELAAFLAWLAAAGSGS